MPLINGLKALEYLPCLAETKPYDPLLSGETSSRVAPTLAGSATGRAREKADRFGGFELTRSRNACKIPDLSRRTYILRDQQYQIKCRPSAVKLRLLLYCPYVPLRGIL